MLYMYRIPVQSLQQLLELNADAKPLIETYFPEYVPDDESKTEAANREEQKIENDRNGSSYQEMRKKELQSKSLNDLTLEDMREIQQMNGMPLSLLEEYNIYMFNECSIMMKQRIDALFLLEIGFCCSEFQDFDVL